MTVLVTGGAGYIGSHMVLEFGDAGERVVVDRLVMKADSSLVASSPESASNRAQ